ncbi:unnamed protein product [Orchesella dallaii]|uniref:Uncharacterized protein n=1 Tax=Orchesella dallaii TaxID=48710 RepID=A0ABP1QQL3_9HEXA
MAEYHLDLAMSPGTSISTDVLEVLCPTEISKIVINEQPSRNLKHTCSADIQLHTMLEQLVHKWCDYQSSLKISPSETAEDISNVYNVTHPGRFRKSGEILESVTFLDFYPHQRINHLPENIASPSPQCEAITRTKVQRKHSFIQEILNEQGQLTKPGVLPEIPSHQTSRRRGEVASEILDQSKWKSSLEETRMSRIGNLSEVIVTHDKESSKHHPKHLRKKHGPLT